ncbi:uncharacterized protein LOC129732274 [Wyeomyia smithii]|uniref:uncharacterized protein LOC129732274 n=1 Tax=Wyeomyia smithii TaxID=174621 RepID=UPI002467E90D|nr:uncharacterized protein LOC129732274 [Wyeomyia smithii]
MSESKQDIPDAPPKVAATGQQPTAESNDAPQYLYDAVARMAPQEGFTPGQFELTFDAGSGKGDGFTGELFRAKIVEGSKELEVLCKIPPVNETRRRQFNSMVNFDREVLVYSKLLPIIYEFQREKGVTEEVGFFNAPKCYLAYYEADSEESVIVMDDLRLKNYRMWNKLVPVNYEHCKLCMIQLGRLHAVSFALKDQKPEMFEQFKVPDPMSKTYKDNEPFLYMMYLSMDRAIATLEPEEEEARQKLLQLKSTMAEDFFKLTQSEKAEPYAVLGHGDCWINNFIYGYENDAPSEIVLLDWQVSRYASPALDLLYFLFCCTDGEFRAAHFEEMLRIYHDSLGSLLKKLGGDPSRQFPFTALKEQIKACGKFGLLMAMFLVPLMCIENQDLPNMDVEAEKFKENQKIDMDAFAINERAEVRLRKRLSAAIRDGISYGYI